MGLNRSTHWQKFKDACADAEKPLRFFPAGASETNWLLPVFYQRNCGRDR